MHKNHSKEKAEKGKLVHKLKQERKGALREIRKDKDFLGRVKVQQKIRRYVIFIYSIFFLSKLYKLMII